MSHIMEIGFNGSVISRENGYRIHYIDGISAAPRRSTTMLFPSKDGGVVYNVRKNIRDIVIQGYIPTASEDEFNTKIRSLVRTFNTPEELPLRIKTWTGAERIITVKVTRGVEGGFGIRNTKNYEWIVMLSSTGNSASFSGTSPAVYHLNLEEVEGFDIPFDIPFDIEGGSGAGSTAIVNNVGDNVTEPSILFTGSVINPTINHSSGYIQFQGSIGSGDTVHIYKEQGNTFGFRNNGENVTRFLRGSLPQFSVGNSLISFTASSFSTEAMATVSVNMLYESVW